MKPERLAAPIEALLVRQRWEVLESGAALADAQHVLTHQEAQVANAIRAHEAWQAEVARVAGQGAALNPALLHWLAGNAGRQAAALNAAQTECARALMAVEEKGSELARHRRVEDLLRDELRDIARETQGRRDARESQDANDLWAQYRRSDSGA
ncbi:hypothetical protein [Niveibacterium sp. COAC-50]|uniref:hypothetical protein n=1 Tax=Niveibacterium sp. COAC-50 TaxID=2729384 RepID=UPI001554F530|nr:hypothetical protein [Niveibacterium sp. COAC-50]